MAELAYGPAAPVRRRRRDMLWETFDSYFGPVANSLERGRRNKALREVREALRSAGIDPESEQAMGELERRCEVAQQIWGDVAFTEVAVASHWSRLGMYWPRGR